MHNYCIILKNIYKQGRIKMIDIAILRENPTLVKENMKKKFQDDKIGLVDEAYKLDRKSVV